MSQRCFLLLMLVLVLPSGCLTAPAATETGAPTAPATPEATTTAVALKETSTVVPTSLTAESPTAAPTLSLRQQRERLQDLYQRSSACRLPCWWGITPGTTPWAQANQILAPLGSISEYQDYPDVNYYFRLFSGGPRDPRGLEMSAGFAVRGGIVQGITFNSYWLEQPPRTSLSEFLRLFGEPDEIWLQLTPVSIDNVPKYSMLLFYRHKGGISLDGDARIVEEGLLEICPQRGPGKNFGLPGVLLWAPDADMAFREIGASVVRGFFGGFASDFTELDSLRANMDRESFYITYAASRATKCLQVQY